MRIGELATAVGVTTRTVRHYHHLGLLPEPERRPNRYREYGLRHAVVLARIRRLTELGLGLAEVRDVLADDAGRELAEVLEELDEDLARQEEAIRERRERLAALMRDGVSAEGPLSPELASLFREMAGGPESPMAAKDREMLALIETAASPEERQRLLAALRDAFEAPGAVERAHEVYALLDALADADPADPRVEDAARAIADRLPDALLPGSKVDGDSSFLRAFYADFAPAQAEALRRTMRMVAERQQEQEQEQDQPSQSQPQPQPQQRSAP
ncbi:MerR family transcriptional regulator [Streptomyces sp. NPDC060223]|uniref:MerR family transcriptional regulator n=1 Tax=unclassified Streptomyces TaxID=2593676 RepID=UPI00363C29B8